MPPERVDYYSDEEFRQAVQQEQQAYEEQITEAEQQEQYIQDCLAALKKTIDEFDYATVDYCIKAFTPKPEKTNPS